jgi:tetratricopeptide (TPR) repeat protein
VGREHERLDGLVWRPWPVPAQSTSVEQVHLELASLRQRADLDSPRVAEIARADLVALAEGYWLLSRLEPEAVSKLLDPCIRALVLIVKLHSASVYQPGDPTLFRLAVALQELGEGGRTNQVLHRLITRVPLSDYVAAAYTLRGDDLRRRGDLMTAVRFYIKALGVPARRSSVAAYTRYALAHAWLQQGQTDLAKIALQQAIDHAKLTHTAHSELVIEASTVELQAFVKGPPNGA